QDLAGLRAGGLQMRTLEVLDQRGIVDRFVSQGQVSRAAPFAASMFDISDAKTRHNYFLALWQVHIERILAEWIGELAVPIRRGRSVTAFRQHDDGVDVELEGGSSLRAQYLVGCDGGRSAIRKLAGIEFPGWDASTSYLIAEIDTAKEPAWGVRRNHRGMNAIAKLDDGKRARVVLTEEARDRDDLPTLDDVRAALVDVYGTDFELQSASYISGFTDMTRQAASYRNGRVLLAGDAAHVHSPVGGQGLNLGVQDAVNLGWKLAQVIRGTSTDALLDTYHAERHPVGARVLRNTMALTAIERSDERSIALREMLTELFGGDGLRRQYFAMMSGLDVHYPLGDGHPLLGRRMPDLELDTADGPRRVFTLLHTARPLLLDLGGALDIAPWSDRVQRVAARYDGAWDLPTVGVVAPPTGVLIRPDGYVAWAGEGTDRGLTEALSTWFGSPSSAG
ncbi:MAG TPA: FAD-dependent monooxygenase, partial [Nannocystaceae bacterium]|nr:FAD-dependent monooxygenase [Nannocystaceae bacterium]